MTIVAITGINSYFARCLLPLLEADPEIEKIIGIDISPVQKKSSKIIFHQKDIREPDIADAISGADTLLHMAFIVQEIRNKKKTHDINITGSKNVFDACVSAGVKKIIYTSSIASYGAHPDNPIGITEDHPLRPNTDSYYSSDKAAVEKYLDGFCRHHPNVLIARLRPPVIIGPNISNAVRDSYKKKSRPIIKGKDHPIQFLQEEDLGKALYLAVKNDLHGVYNIAADNASTSRRIYEMADIQLKEISSWMLKILASVTFFLGLGNASKGWVSLGEHPIVVNCDKFKNATGWRPKYTTEEAFKTFLDTLDR